MSKLPFKSLIMLSIAGTSLCSYAALGATSWTPKKVNWQVIRAQNQANENICAIRWNYDHEAELMFVNTRGGYEFQLKNISESKNLPQFQIGDKFNAIVTKHDSSITQFFSEVTQSNGISISFGQDLTNLKFFSTIKSIAFIFEDSLIDLPTPNAIENFSAYKKCMEILTGPIQSAAQTTESKEPEPSKTETSLANTLTSNAYEHLDEVSKRALARPPRMSNTPTPIPSQTHKASANQLDGFDLETAYSSDNEINKSFIKKLSLLEREKEELRKKLLSMTKESMIADIVSCEPSAGDAEAATMSSITEESYKATIEQLREENRKLRELVPEDSTIFDFDD